MVVEVEETAIGAEAGAKAEVEARAETDKHMGIVFLRQIAEHSKKLHQAQRNIRHHEIIPYQKNLQQPCGEWIAATSLNELITLALPQ